MALKELGKEIEQADSGFILCSIVLNNQLTHNLFGTESLLSYLPIMGLTVYSYK